MNFEIRPLSDVMGAEVIGIDLAQPLGDGDFSRIRQAWLDHLVLVFRDQHMTPEQHIAFSKRLGPLEIHFANHFLLPGHPEVYVLSNVVEAGQSLGKAPTPYWHSDLSYMARPAKGSMLYAREVPAVGGDTLYSNMYLAYERLPEDVRTRIAGLTAVHNISDFPLRYAKMSGQSADTLSKASLEIAKHLPEVIHPLVIRHPETGRSALFCNEGFTTRVVGLPEAESEQLLAFLNEHSKRSEFTYRHKWRQFDANLWDNRCVNHSATGGFQAPMRRLMHRTTIGGEVLHPAIT
jgi:taurine dioxygenase